MNILLILTFIFAILDWYAVATHRRTLEYVAKPATMLLLILWFTTLLPTSPPIMTSIFTLGLALSLVGDVFLMLPDRFLPGVLAFMLAHVAYIVSYNWTGILITPGTILVLIILGIVTLLIIRPILKALRNSDKGQLVLPISIYAVVLALTLWSTSTTLFRLEWPWLGAVFAALGGLLFYISDALNAWRRFVGRVPGDHLPIMITYHLAQFLMAAGWLIGIGILG